MPTVFDNLELPGNEAADMKRVNVYLVASLTDSAEGGTSTTQNVSILDRKTGLTNAAGYVGFDLRANSLIDPANTFYIWDVHLADGQVWRRTIEVPNGPGPYWVKTLEISAPIPVSRNTVASIAALNALVGVADRTYVWVEDIRRLYRWDEADNQWQPVDDSTVVNVWDFGLLATNTAAQNVTAVDAAIARLPAGGGVLLFPAGTFELTPSQVNAIPTGTHIHGMGYGLTRIKWPNRATWATDPGVQYTFIADTGATDIEVDGICFDGNRDNGNHSTFAGVENFDALWFSSDNERINVHHNRFTNFRGDSMYVNRQSGQPKHISFCDNLVDDVGIKEVGDGGNARMGVAFISADDAIVRRNIFDTIGAFAVDFEGDSGADSFDGVNIGDNTYRDVGSGAVNVTSPGTVNNVRVDDDPIAGTTGAVAYSIPAAQKRTQTVRRTAGNLTFNNTVWGGLAASAGLTASLFDLVLPAKPNDIIEVSISAWWSDTGAANGCLDVVTLDGGGAIVNRFSTANNGGTDYGIAAFLGITGVRSAVGGSVFLTLGSTDPVNGFVTLRPYNRNDAAANRTIAGLAGAGNLAAFQFSARNLGPQG